MSWQSPLWSRKVTSKFNQLEERASNHSIAVLSVILLFSLLAIAGQYTYIYQQNKPKPIQPAEILTKTVEYELIEPQYPDVSQPDLKQSLLIIFSDSAAPIDKIGTPLDAGIQITPATNGVWKWESEYNLRFTADESFILGQKYRINLAAEKILANNIKLSDSKAQSAEFYAPDFHTKIVSAELGTSSIQSDQRNAFFTIQFPVLVDKKSFESAIKLEKSRFISSKNQQKQPIKYTVRYNEENPLIAYIQSEELPLEDYENTLRLEISDAVKGEHYSLPAKTKSTTTLNIPNQFGLNVEHVYTDFVETTKMEQRLLIVNFNDPVDTETAKQSIQAWLLPEKHEGTWSIEQIKDQDLTERVTLTPIAGEEKFNENEEETTADGKKYSNYSKNLAFNFDAPQNRILYIQIGNNITASQSGYRLKKPVNQLVNVTPFEPKLQFTSEGTILPLKGSKTLDITSRNLNGMQVELYRLRPNQLQNFIWQNDEELAYWNDPGTESHFTDYFTQFVNFADSNASNLSDDSNRLNFGKTVHHPLDLSSFLSEDSNHPRGIFLIKLRKWDGKNSDIQPPLARNFVDQDWLDWETYSQSNQSANAVEKGQVFDQRIIVVTDIGIITKRDIDQTWHVFANSISENKPLANAKISVIAKNGSEILHEMSDETGHVHFPSLASFTHEKEPSYFLVESSATEPALASSQDFSFLPVFYNYDRMLDFSRFDIGGNQQPRDPKSLNSYLFSDRGVYRPGDTFNIGIITRTTDWSNQLIGIPLLAVIYDARYQEVKRQPIVLDQSGFNELSFTTSENASTGEWRIELYLPGKTSNPQVQNSPLVELNQDAKLIGYVALNVKEFEPDRLKVNLNLSPKSVNGGWVKPDELKAQVNVNTLFGTPAQNRRVTANLSLRPTYPHFVRYNKYQFYENAPNRDGISEELAELSTDEMGIADIKMSLNSYEMGTYQLNLLVEAFEAGAGRSVAATARALISPYDYLIGFKASDNLEFINQNTKRHVNLIAINSSLEQIPIDSLSLELFERKYLSVLTQQNSGAYKYESKLKETLIKKESFAISATEGVAVKNDFVENYLAENDFQLDTATPGDYVLVVKNTSGQTLNRIYYSVTGNADITRDLTRNSELKVKLDQAVYKPGDKMQISINAPYSGTGLITIERDKVYSWQWFHSDTTHSVQEITLPELPNFEGNAYVTVQFIRDSNSPEIFMSPLSYAAIPFQLSHEARTANIMVISQERVKSGEVLSMTVKTDSPQKVILFAVDEGILQVARYRLKDPLDYFFQKRALEVKSAQILDLILPEYQQLAQFFAAAGGDGSEALDQHLNPFKRKRDKPVAFWSGIKEVNGEETFTYQLPEYYNGKVRVMAISVTPKVIGHSQSETTVNDDIVLLPNSPATVAPEDTFDVSMSLTNTLNNAKPQLIKVKLTPSSGLSLLSEAQQTIELKSQQEGMLNFRLQANQQLGNADLTFSIEYQDQHDENRQLVTQSRTTSISIRPLTPYRSDIRMGRMRSSPQEISDLRTMYPNYARNQASVSFSPLLLAKSLNDFLNESTHLSSEHLISKGIASVIMQTNPHAKTSVQNAVSELQSTFAILQNRQNSRGAIGFWQLEQHPDPFITTHAVMLMLEAKSAGFEVPSALLSNANQFLSDLSQDQNLYDISELRLRAYAAYLLAKQGEVVTTQVTDIERRLIEQEGKESSDLTAVYLAATYQLLQLDQKAEAWLKPTIRALSTAYNKAWWSVNYWDPLVIDATRLSLIATHFPQHTRDLPPQVLDNLQTMLNESRFTSLSSAMTVIALARYVYVVDILLNETIQSQNNTASNVRASNAQPLLIKRAFIDASNKRITEVISNSLNSRLMQDIEKDHINVLDSINTVNSVHTVTGDFSNAFDNPLRTKGIIFTNQTELPAWYNVTQSGFDYQLDKTAIKDGLEISRQYSDANNQPVDHVKLGETLNVTVKVRAISKEGMTKIAIVDLLPGGFDVVEQTASPYVDESNSYEYNQDEQIGEDQNEDSDEDNSSHLEFREDRVLIYTTATDNVQTFNYQIKPTNSGAYQIPAIFVQALYNRRVQAVSTPEMRILNVTNQ